MQLPGSVVCLVCGAVAAAWPRLAARPCAGWAASLPPRVAAWLGGGGAIRRGGGDPAGLAAAAQRRLGAFPAAPD
eukprot:3312712-Lingulodinium_polyedra.AAC.1